jgi:hypothetical protein
MGALCLANLYTQVDFLLISQADLIVRVLPISIVNTISSCIEKKFHQYT